MKIIDDVKKDLRFLIEAKLNKEKAVQTVAKLYEKERLNTDSISLWYDQVRKDIPSYVRHTEEPQLCDIKKSIVGGKTIKGTIITHGNKNKKKNHKDGTPYYKKGGERRWHNIVVGGTMILARRNIKVC